MTAKITPLILTFNEAANIARTLARLTWAQDIVVVDSYSTDGTLEILAEHPRVRVFSRVFTTHAEQWNFGLEQTGIGTEWILALDADYVLSEDLIFEICCLEDRIDIGGYRAGFNYCVNGQPLRGAAYPPVVVLFRRETARYVQDGHTQRVQVSGEIKSLRGKIFHDDRKPLSQWLAAQGRYMELEATKIRMQPFRSLGTADRLRRMIVLAPVAMLFFCLIVRGNILDGWAGIFYALQRVTAEAILSLFLLRQMLDVREH